jgi:RNA polymerase sigma factor (sigma-70 family)
VYLAKNKPLLAAFKAGDRSALDNVYRQYSRGVRAFLGKGFTFRSGKGNFHFRGIHDDSELDSSVQEVFRRAFEERARTSYNGINSFTNWVLAIARNMVINSFRNREVAVSQYVAATDDRGVAGFMDREMSRDYSGVLYAQAEKRQDVLVEDAELKQLITNFLQALSEPDRQLLTCRFIDGLGQEEAARTLGSTRMKVRTTEARLRNRLRAFLRHTGYVDPATGTKA